MARAMFRRGQYRESCASGLRVFYLFRVACALHSFCNMGKAVCDPWEQVRERTNGNGDEEIRALLRDADEMRRFIEHVRRYSTWNAWPLHADAAEVLAGLGRPMDPKRVSAERREPICLEEPAPLNI